jgi:tetratricopeptide (TPR) repeat protein
MDLEPFRETDRLAKKSLPAVRRTIKRAKRSMLVGGVAGLVAGVTSQIAMLPSWVAPAEVMALVLGWVTWQNYYLIKANTQYRRDQYDHALEFANKAIRRHPRCPDAYITAAAACIGSRDAELALDYCNRAMAVDDQHELMFNNRCCAYLQLSEFEEAICDANRCIELAPKIPNGYYLLAVAKISLNQYDEAIRLLDKAISLNPKWLTPWTFRAFAQIGKCQYEKGLEDCNKVIEAPGKISPVDLSLALFGRAAVHYNRRDLEKAVYEATQASELWRELDGCLLLRAIANCYLGEYEKAEEDLDAISRRKSSLAHNARRLALLARIRIEQGDLDSAFSFCEGAEGLYADDTSIGTTGLALLHAGRNDEAIGKFDRCVEINPFDSEAYWLRAKAYEKLGQPQRAKVDFDKAVDLHYRPHLKIP